MKFGALSFKKISQEDTDLLAAPSFAAAKNFPADELLVAAIDPTLADTATFCEKYDILPADGANCVIVEAKRGDKTWYAAVLIGGDARADINGVVRRALDAKKISFAPMDAATKLTHMEYGGITPIGLPAEWPILVDTAVTNLPWAVIGSGVRHSKLLVTGKLLGNLPNSTILNLKKGET